MAEDPSGEEVSDRRFYERAEGNDGVWVGRLTGAKRTRMFVVLERQPQAEILPAKKDISST